MLLTTPPKLTTTDFWLLTGNDYVSVPFINKEGAIRQIGLIHQLTNSLIQFEGGAEGLLKPYVEVDGRVLKTEFQWSMVEHWLPRGQIRIAGLEIVAEVLAPVNTKGFLYRLTVINRSDRRHQLLLGFSGSFQCVNRSIFRSFPLKDKQVVFDDWTKTLVLSTGSYGLIPSLAVGGDIDWLESRVGTEGYQLQKSCSLDCGERASFTLYGAVNKEPDGAATSVIHLRRQGWCFLYKETLGWLNKHKISFPKNSFRTLFYRNYWFNYFYAVGKSVDTGEIVPMTSRSSRYYVSSAFWARDSLLWSFPAILLVSQARAKEILLVVFARHGENAGEHAHYIDGSVLYPGFELDQAAAYIIALARYLKWTKDYSILRDESIRQGLDKVMQKILSNKTKLGLYRTFLDPSDDPICFPYLTYDNVICWRAFKDIAQIYLLMGSKGGYQRFNIEAQQLKKNIYRYCLIKGPTGRMFPWATDGRGNFELYDAPPGSLQLLSWYGFCRQNDPLYQNTVSWIFSDNNPYYCRGLYEGVGSKHAPHPWVFSLCNSLLSQKSGEALDVLGRISMDNGFASETYSGHTGKALTGAAFATCAGFLSYSLWEYFCDN